MRFSLIFCALFLKTLSRVDLAASSSKLVQTSDHLDHNSGATFSVSYEHRLARHHAHRALKQAEQKRRDAHLEKHFVQARRLKALGRHGHSHELEFKNLNIHINTFSQRRHLDEEMLKVPFHEKHLSHDELVRQQECIVAKLGEQDVEESDQLDPGQQRRKLSTAAKPCRTPYEKCISNALADVEMDEEDHDSGNRYRHEIWSAAEACNHLSSISNNHMREHQQRRLSTTAIHMNHHIDMKNTREDVTVNPTVWGERDYPAPDELHAWLLKKFPHRDSHSNQMRHCMLYKATDRDWHDEHGAENPHSMKLAEIQCWHDTYGMYDRVHPLHALIVHDRGTLTLPHIAHPRQSRRLMAKEGAGKRIDDGEYTEAGDLMLIPNNLPSLVIVKGLFRKYDADKSQTLDQREAERICRGQDMCNSLADIWRHLDQPGKANKPVSYEDFELAFREFLIGRSGIRDHLPEHIEQHDMDGDEALSLSEFRTMCRAFKICDISAALPTATQLFDRGLKDGQDRASSLSKSTIMSVFEQHMVPSHDDDGHQRREL